jgi:glucose/arabinose dehydrogenase
LPAACSGTPWTIASHGRVQALNLSTGASAPGWPLQSVYNPTLQHNYGGWTLSPDGTLYVAVGVRGSERG